MGPPTTKERVVNVVDIRSKKGIKLNVETEGEGTESKMPYVDIVQV